MPIPSTDQGKVSLINLTAKYNNGSMGGERKTEEKKDS